MTHCEEVPVSEFNDLPDVNEFNEEVESSASDSGESVFKSSLSTPEQFKQKELSDLIRISTYLTKHQKYCHPHSKQKLP